MDLTTILPYIFPTLVLLVMLAGWIGLIIPVYPGLTIIWLAALVFAIIQGLQWPGWLFFSLLTLLMIAGNLADNILIGARAKQTGAAWSSILVGYLAGLIGTFLIPAVGGVLLTILGVFLMEWLRRKEWRTAWKVTVAMVFGIGWAVLVRLLIGGIMIALWLAWYGLTAV